MKTFYFFSFVLLLSLAVMEKHKLESEDTAFRRIISFALLLGRTQMANGSAPSLAVCSTPFLLGSICAQTQPLEGGGLLFLPSHLLLQGIPLHDLMQL